MNRLNPLVYKILLEQCGKNFKIHQIRVVQREPWKICWGLWENSWKFWFWKVRVQLSHPDDGKNKLGSVWMKMDNIQIPENGRKWNMSKLLTSEIPSLFGWKRIMSGFQKKWISTFDLMELVSEIVNFQIYWGGNGTCPEFGKRDVSKMSGWLCLSVRVCVGCVGVCASFVWTCVVYGCRWLWDSFFWLFFWVSVVEWACLSEFAHYDRCTSHRCACTCVCVCVVCLCVRVCLRLCVRVCMRANSRIHMYMYINTERNRRRCRKIDHDNIVKQIYMSFFADLECSLPLEIHFFWHPDVIRFHTNWRVNPLCFRTVHTQFPFQPTWKFTLSGIRTCLIFHELGLEI